MSTCRAGGRHVGPMMPQIRSLAQAWMIKAHQALQPPHHEHHPGSYMHTACTHTKRATGGCENAMLYGNYALAVASITTRFTCVASQLLHTPPRKSIKQCSNQRWGTQQTQAQGLQWRDPTAASQQRLRERRWCALHGCGLTCSDRTAIICCPMGCPQRAMQVP